jgi:hypothetical protein
LGNKILERTMGSKKCEATMENGETSTSGASRIVSVMYRAFEKQLFSLIKA